MTRPSLGSFSLALGDGKEKNPGNEVNEVAKTPRQTLFLTIPSSESNWRPFRMKDCYVPVKSKLQHPSPGQPPGHLNFWKILFKFPPSPGWKAVQMPPPPGKLPDYYSNFSVASIMLLKLCIETWFNRQHIFIYYKYKSFLNTFKYGTQLV